jgi:hypothetical protein
MAKLPKGIFIRGNIDGFNFYIMKKKRPHRTYCRKKSSLTRERVLKDKEFEKTRSYASKLAIASRMASGIYKALPRDIKGHWLYRTIAGDAASLLYEGKTEEVVKQLLWDKYIYKPECGHEESIQKGWRNLESSSKESRVKLREVFGERWAKEKKSFYEFKRFRWVRGGRFREKVKGRLELVDLRI